MTGEHGVGGKRNNLKRTIYLLLAALLGLLLSGIAHAVIEIVSLNTAVNNASPVVWRHYLDGAFSCSLPPVAFYGLPVLGIVGGFLTGRVWWRWVYVEKRSWRNWKNHT